MDAAIDGRRLRPRRQHAVLLQDESESATMSFGGSGQHRQGAVSLHPHRRLQGWPRAAAAGAVTAAPVAPGPRPGSEATPPADAGMSTTGPGASTEPRAQQPGQQPSHKQLTGHKHRRDGGPAAAAAATAAAAAKSAGAGRNGSDSGSNSPGDQTPARGSQQDPEDAQVEEAGRPAKQAKQARGTRKA